MQNGDETHAAGVFFRFRLHGVSHTAIGGLTLQRLRSEWRTVSLRITQYAVYRLLFKKKKKKVSLLNTAQNVLYTT